MLACPTNHVIFLDEDEAWQAALEVERRTGVPIAAIPCKQCHYWHVRPIANTR